MCAMLRRLGLASLLLAFFSHPMSAATIVVNETTCTLVDAIAAANTDTAVDGCAAGAGADIVELTTDVLLTEVNNNHLGLGNNSLPVIESDITIEGAGFAIRAWYFFYCSRFFLVLDNGTLTLNDTILEPGGGAQQSEASIPGPCGLNGVGIRNRGSLILSNTMLLSNSSWYGSGNNGAILNEQGSVSLTDCTLSGNAGGGIVSRQGSVSMTHSTISDNYGSGVLLWEGNLNVTNSTLSGNRAGIIVQNGDLNMTSSTVSNHHVETNGAGIFCGGSSCMIRNSTLSGNSAGGCVDDFDPHSCLPYGHGGAIYGTAPASILIVNSTLFGNNSEKGGPIGWQSWGSPPSLKNSIVASPHGNPCPGAVNDLGNNFSEAGCGPGIIVITGLAPTLADNGGPTPTHALLPGSSAIDAAGDCGLVSDQRGFVRWDGACDGGAFELGATPADADQDGVLDAVDVCLHTTIPGSVPTNHLGVNRWALIDDDDLFDTTLPPGGGGEPGFEFTVEDTHGCSCEQIIEAMALGWGHTKFGCSTGVMLQWIATVD